MAGFSVERIVFLSLVLDLFGEPFFLPPCEEQGTQNNPSVASVYDSASPVPSHHRMVHKGTAFSLSG